MNKRKDFYYQKDNNKKIKKNYDEKKLSTEQQNVIDIALNSISIFYTGLAGTEKSFLLKYLIEKLRVKYENNEVIITATMGLAALLIDIFVVNRLNKLRLGIIDEDFLKYINSLQQELICNRIIDFFIEEKNTLKCINCKTIFYRKDVTDLKRHIKKIHMRSRILEFKSEDWSVVLFSDSQDNELPSYKQLVKYLKRKNLANKILCLKVGTKVISIYNDKENKNIVNEFIYRIKEYDSSSYFSNFYCELEVIKIEDGIKNYLSFYDKDFKVINIKTNKKNDSYSIYDIEKKQQITEFIYVINQYDSTSESYKFYCNLLVIKFENR
ncbi:40168_t:CDS:2, partial [Gigaspora margarita]